MVLYQLAIALYGIAIRIASILNPKARSWIRGRKNWEDDLRLKLQNNTQKVIWIHCASLGEFEQGRPIIEQIRKADPHVCILLSFFSPSGYNIRKDYPLVNYVCYLPLDTLSNARKFVSIVQPSAVIFVKYEFWFNLLDVLSKLKIKTYFVSVIIREDQFLFNKIASNYLSKLKRVTHVFLQNNESYQLLESRGFENISVAGDTRFDRVFELSKQEFNDVTVSQFKSNKKILIAGSTWLEDEDLLSEIALELKKAGIKIIIAPHEINEEHLADVERKLSALRVVKYSNALQAELSDADVLLVDCIGKLMSMYAYGNYAFIGGGFGKGIHNTLEPACFGLPIFFGPKYHKFNEAKMMIQQGSACSISKADELLERVHELESDHNKLAIIQENNRKFIVVNSGATARILERILQDIYTT